LRSQIRDRFPPEFHPGGYRDVPDDHLRWFPHEPEASRYGGKRGLEVAERFFCYSSKAALRFLETCRGKENPIRLGKGLLAMVALLHSFLDTREQAYSLMRQHKTEYLENIPENEEQKIKLEEHFKEGYNRQRNTLSAYVSETWTRLDMGSSLPPTLNDYYKNICSLSDDFDKLLNNGELMWNGKSLGERDKGTGLIIRTYIHMMNNRLGIPIPEEAYLSHLTMNGITSK
jgi:thiopeptide-type bacteriocin biosynthesis protein